MIVRITTDNQYRVDDALRTDIARLDTALMDALGANDEARFDAALTEMINLVRKNGQVVPDEELVPSDLILPIPDMTLEECRQIMDRAPVQPA